MTKGSKLLMGAAIIFMGTASLAAAFPGGKGGMERGEGPRGPMMLQMFDQLDADGDGKLTAEEIEAMGPASAFSTADTNGDGLLSGDELSAFTDAQNAARKARRQQMMLQRLDTNEDGQLSLDEIQARGPNREQMFANLDKDGDGAITKTELEQARKFMKRGFGEQRGERGEHGKRWNH